MDAANNFNVDITDHSTQTRFVRGGGTQDITRVTFFVGKYGPFTEEFTKGSDDAEAIRARINNKVQALRLLNNAQY